jgi:hypothetical protein
MPKTDEPYWDHGGGSTLDEYPELKQQLELDNSGVSRVQLVGQ